MYLSRRASVLIGRVVIAQKLESPRSPSTDIYVIVFSRSVDEMNVASVQILAVIKCEECNHLHHTYHRHG